MTEFLDVVLLVAEYISVTVVLLFYFFQLLLDLALFPVEVLVFFADVVTYLGFGLKLRQFDFELLDLVHKYSVSLLCRL
mgnify:CR=1 FL=1